MGLVTGRSLDWRSARAATAKVQGDQNATDRRSINHTDVLDTIRQVAGYTSFQMPNKEATYYWVGKATKNPVNGFYPGWGFTSGHYSFRQKTKNPV